ncbi:MAG: 3-dehydroquinate synthase, partial [Bacteroidota bacterium]
MPDNLPPYLSISNDVSKDISRSVEKINPDKVAILVDENTQQHCLPLLDIHFDIVIQIKSGEAYKNLQTCEFIWSELTKAHFTRKSLLINLGGGVIGDMGGFAAAT